MADGGKSDLIAKTFQKVEIAELQRISSRVFPVGWYHVLGVSNYLNFVAFLHDNLIDVVEPTDEIGMKNMMKIQNQMKKMLRGPKPHPSDHKMVLWRLVGEQFNFFYWTKTILCMDAVV